MGNVTECTRAGQSFETNTLKKHNIRTLVLPPRFCISENHGLRQPKYRVIDDLSRPLVNSTADTADAYCPQDSDTLVAQTRLLPTRGATDLRNWSVDFPNA